MKKVLAGIALSLVSAAVVHGQAKLTGTWEGSTKNGTHVLLEVKATKTALTGTLTTEGQAMPLADGKVSKNKFTFNVTRGETTYGFTGEIAGDQITMWMDARGPSNAAVLKRVKK